MENCLQRLETSIRPWTLSDIEFICRVRNTPELMRWFRQDMPITYKQQMHFMERRIDYNGNIVMYGDEQVGLCSVNLKTQEFSIAILPEYQKKGIASKVMELMYERFGNMWSEVFVDNPALSWYLYKCGFKATGVKERAYYKRNIGLIDVVRIEKK